jgi:phytoene dehydrogenase-like protein
MGEISKQLAAPILDLDKLRLNTRVKSIKREATTPSTSGQSSGSFVVTSDSHSYRCKKLVVAADPQVGLYIVT